PDPRTLSLHDALPSLHWSVPAACRSSMQSAGPAYRLRCAAHAHIQRPSGRSAMRNILTRRKIMKNFYVTYTFPSADSRDGFLQEDRKSTRLNSSHVSI